MIVEALVTIRNAIAAEFPNVEVNQQYNAFSYEDCMVRWTGYTATNAKLTNNSPWQVIKTHNWVVRLSYPTPAPNTEKEALRGLQRLEARLTGLQLFPEARGFIQTFDGRLYPTGAVYGTDAADPTRTVYQLSFSAVQVEV